MKRVGVIIGIFLIIALTVGEVLRYQKKRETPAGKIQVTATFYPLAEFARQIGKDKATVATLVPVGAEPHDFDPSPQDILTIQKSKVFIYNGVGLETWIDRVVDGALRSHTIVVEAVKGIDLLPATKEGGKPQASPLYDPHVWTNPVLASKEVETIARGFATADPSNASFYQENAVLYKAKLADLDKAFMSGLAYCDLRMVVTSHNAFSYAAKQYNFTVIPISGVSPDEEPSPQKMAEIVTFSKQNNIKYIFFETLVNPKLSQTIANEIGAKTLVFNPLEGLTQKEIDKGTDYLSVQRDNLLHSKEAMQCH